MYTVELRAVGSASGIGGVGTAEFPHFVGCQRAIAADGEFYQELIDAVRASSTHTADADPSVLLKKFDVGVGHEAVPLANCSRDRNLTF
jgi:hypothetical protein